MIKTRFNQGLFPFWLWFPLFIVVCGFKFFFTAYAQSLLLKVSPWAESGTQYFFSSQEDGFLSLLKTDASYYVLPQRLISWAYWLFTESPKYFFHYLSAFSLILVIGCGLYVLHPIHRKFISSDFSRFILALILISHPDYEMYTFINVMYFVWIPLMFILLNNELWTSSLKRQSLLFIMCSLMILTKAAFIAVASLILFQIWETFKVQRKWDLRAALFIPILVQCVSLLKNPDHVQSPSILKMNLADVAWTLLTAPIVNLSRTFFYFIGSDLFKIILTLSVLVLIFKKKDQLFLNKPAISKITLLGLIALYFCHTFLGVASLNTRIVVPYPRGIDNFTDMRGFFIGAITSLVVIWMLIDKLKFQFPILSRFFMGFLFFFSIFSVPYRFSSPREPALPMVGSPEWQQVWPEAKRESFCIPINPYPWFMMKNCRALQSIPEYSQMKNHEFGLYKLQESISKYQISVLGFKAPENSELRVAENERIEFKKIKGQNGISYFFPSLALNGNFTFLLQETNATRKNPIEHFEKSASFENIIVLGH